MAIDSNTSLEELAALISHALEAAGIPATLSGGSVVTIYSENEYQSVDLDFVTSEGRAALRSAIEPLGFYPSGNVRQFEHPHTDWFVEFPTGPLSFGDTYVDHCDVPPRDTDYGPLRIITPTQSVMDRLAAFWYHNDPQTWDQAIMVTKHQNVDWKILYAWAESEGQDRSDIDRLRKRANR